MRRQLKNAISTPDWPICSRRAFLRKTCQLTSVVALAPAGPICAAGIVGGDVMTVLGAIRPEQMGVTLPHEHCVVDFLGAEAATTLRRDADDAFTTILPHLKGLKEHGCSSLVECTPNYIGR